MVDSYSEAMAIHLANCSTGMSRFDAETQQSIWSQWVGQPVRKKNRKPFKSGAKTGTVKAITVNPNTNLPAFTIIEDDSIVDCRQVHISKPGIEQ